MDVLDVLELLQLRQDKRDCSKKGGSIMRPKTQVLPTMMVTVMIQMKEEEIKGEMPVKETSANKAMAELVEHQRYENAEKEK